VLLLFDDCTIDTERREIRRGTQLVSTGPQVFDLVVHLIRNRQAVTASAFVAPPSLLEAPSGILAVPDRPSIAVLPFSNMSDDRAQDYFADGITEDIITELSRIRRLFVIARNSTFVYKGGTRDIKQIGCELGVRYALEGSVRQAGHRVRITAQPIDASTGTHLWADRFDGELADIFDLQDQVTTNVVAAIGPKLEQAEIERVKRKPTENLNAYDYFLRAMACFHRQSRQANAEALRLFREVIELDPDFAAAYALAARCYGRRKANRWMIDPSQEAAEATRLARQAIELGPDDAVALCNAGWVLDHIAGDTRAAVVFIDRARALNPNLATAWLASGWARFHLTDFEVAIEHFARAMRLSPLDSLMCSMQTGISASHFCVGRYDEAASWAERALYENPNWHPALIQATVSNAFAGHLGRAQKIVSRLRDLDPALRISNISELTPFPRPEDRERHEEGLRRAGLPE
jgi:TolB-like protein/Flp pilus assembly protein TadD